MAEYYCPTCKQHFARPHDCDEHQAFLAGDTAYRLFLSGTPWETIKAWLAERALAQPGGEA